MKILFQKWFNNSSKVISLISYKDAWEKPDFWFHTNGANKKNGDNCFDLNIHLGYLCFSYTNFDLQRRKQNNI